ncbi:uncharacterized protein [Macrobrachium rosenbergii]|uniref:uncharacterized protein isoform X2 n=1 Tax=Macrobrachium rosenbergii TaxID=79674 RepID=UPI0034D59209
MAGQKLLIGGCFLLVLLMLFGCSPAVSKPIVDPGLFVIQGVSSCINGTGYCMLGNNCSVDVDFLPDLGGGHCKGLRDAFTPKIDFICCRYNPLGKATSKPPTTTINSYTITDVFSLIDAEVANQQENEDEIPEDFNPENVIDIVGVVTDFTGIVGLVTRPWTGTFPTKATSPTTTPMTPETPSTTPAPFSPATPLDVEQIIVELQTEGTATETPPETTESYNEIPTETTGPSVANQQNKEPEVTTTFPSHRPVDEIENEDDQHEETEEVALAMVINNESASTLRPPSSSSSVSSLATPIPIPSETESTTTQISSFSSQTTHAPATSGYLFDENAIIFPDNPIVSHLPLLETEALEAETETIINALQDTLGSGNIQAVVGGSVSESGTGQQQGVESLNEIPLGLEHLGDIYQQQGSAGAGLAEIHQQQQESSTTGPAELPQQQQESLDAGLIQIHLLQPESSGAGLADNHQEHHESSDAGLVQSHLQQQELSGTALAETPQQHQQESSDGVLAETDMQQPAGTGIVGQELLDRYPEKPNVADYDYDYDYTDHQHLLQPVNKNICGFKGFKNYFGEGSASRILGGTVASTVEWCWVAAIMERRQSGDKYMCSGALVESDLVVTTATCLKKLKSRDVNKYIVVLGDSNLQEDLPYGIQFHRIMEVVTHPDYFTSGGAHANDVGVLRLRDHATLSDNVCLVCMTQQDAIFPAQSCTVAGYGIGDVPNNMLREVRDAVPSEGVLRQMSVPILKQQQCEASLHNMTGSEILAKSDYFLCAGGLDGTNACYSTMDGGSPLACEAGGRWFLAGVVSWTRDCEKQDVPNVYTRVSSFSNWIQATHLRMLGFLTHQITLT